MAVVVPARIAVEQAPQQRLEKRGDDGLDRGRLCAGVVAGHFQRPHPLVVHDPRPARDHLAQQIVLAAEVIVDEGEIDAGDVR